MAVKKHAETVEELRNSVMMAILKVETDAHHHVLQNLTTLALEEGSQQEMFATKLAV